MFLGTAFCGVQAAKNANSSSAGTSTLLLLYIALTFSVSLTVNAWLFYRVSGGLFNPALTLAFVLLRLMPPIKGVLLVFTQLVAGIVAAGVAKALVPGYRLDVQTGVGPGITSAQAVFIEVILTAELTLAVLMVLPPDPPPFPQWA